MTAIEGRLLLVPMNLEQPETPQEHIRNGLAILIAMKDAVPGTWAMNPPLARATRRAQAAVVLVETKAPPDFAIRHLERAVEALTDPNLDWVVLPAVQAACVRLIHAVLLLRP